MSDLFSREFVVKVCGVTTPEDARAVAAAGADAVGAILCTSPRRVDAARARAVFAAAGIASVAVARSDEPDSLAAALDAGPAIVQVHGPIPDEYLAELRSRGLGVIRALAHDDPGFADFDDRPVDALLVDGSTPGSGRPHSFFALLSRPFLRPVAAAGGLTPETVGPVVERFDVWGVDVATGVEASPGVKDHARVAEFVRAARAAYDAREAQRG